MAWTKEQLWARAAELLYGGVRSAAGPADARRFGISKTTLHDIATGKRVSEDSLRAFRGRVETLPRAEYDAITQGRRLLEKFSPAQMAHVAHNVRRKEGLKGDRFKKAVKEYHKKGKRVVPVDVVRAYRDPYARYQRYGSYRGK